MRWNKSKIQSRIKHNSKQICIWEHHVTHELRDVLVSRGESFTWNILGLTVFDLKI